MTNLYLFDMDGTLVHDYLRTGPNGLEPNPDHPYEEPHLMPGRLERLQQLALERASFGICTNQAGAALGYCTVEDTQKRIGKALGLIRYFHGRPYTVQVAYHHPKATVAPWSEEIKVTDAYLERRKPNGGMIRDAIKLYEDAVTPSSTVFVGDRQSDKDAAEDAGVRFEWAKDFFEEES